MKHATYDFMTRAETHTHTPTKPKSRIKIFNHLHDSLCNPLDSLSFIHLLISSNPLATLGANKDSFHQAHVYELLRDDSVTKLYPSCSIFSRLSAILRLFNIKARNGWTDITFIEMLELLYEILPEGHTLSPVTMRSRRYYVQ